MSTRDRLQDQLNAARTAQQSIYNLLDQLPEEYDRESSEHQNYQRAKTASSAVAEIVNDLAAAAAVADH